MLSLLQPNAYVNYDVGRLSDYGQRYMASGEGQMLHSNFTRIYADAVAACPDLTDLSYVFDRYAYPAIVEVIHYSPDFNRFLAEEVHALLPPQLGVYRFEADSATGHGFVPSSMR